MKKLYTLVLASLLSISAFAQAPEKMSYQAVVRDVTNNLVASSTVGMRISILQGSPSGTALFIETQTPTSNANGLVTIEIGGGTLVSGNFSTIDWANGPYYIQTEIDPAGGTSYTITGTSQLLSVPYALYSSNSTPGLNFKSSVADLMPSVGELPMYDGSTYTTLLTMTASSSGQYWLSFHTETYEQTNMVNPVMSLCAIKVNGVVVEQTSQNITQHTVGRSLSLSTGDIVEIVCASNIGGGYAINSHATLMRVQ